MKNHALRLALAFSAATLAACGAMNPPVSSMSSSADADAVVLLNATTDASALQPGCWATFYDQRNFTGDSMTLVGPVELQTFDKGSARQLKRDIRSVVTGPRATLVLYERQFLSARSVGFTPGTREGGMAEKLGYGGRVESMRLTCN